MEVSLGFWELVGMAVNGGYVYSGERGGLHYYKFYCRACGELVEAYNQGKTSKLRVKCPECRRVYRYGYLWIDRG